VPELPEVHALAAGLSVRMSGHRIDRCRLASFSALKTVEPALDELVGRTVAGVERRGKLVCVDTGSLWLVARLARGGWIRWYDRLPTTAVRPGRGPIALRVGTDDGGGFDVTEMGTEKRLALWVARGLDQVRPLVGLGVDPLGTDFTAERLGELLAATRATVKTALTDQSVIAGIGNAYSDEALHRARLSPYKVAGTLTAPEVARLHRAVVEVLTEAVDRGSSVDMSDLKGDKKRWMAVHGRTGEPCPVCGDTVRQVSFATRSQQYCPTCQTGGRVLADRRMSRLLR
jgi:formamidopyrimidine-DNA glycosylase